VVKTVKLSRGQLISLVVATVILVIVYLLAKGVKPGDGTYWITVPAALVILVAGFHGMVLGRNEDGTRPAIKRLGIILAEFGSLMLLSAKWIPNPVAIPWILVVLVWGMAFAWIGSREISKYGHDKPPHPVDEVLKHKREQEQKAIEERRRKKKEERGNHE